MGKSQIRSTKRLAIHVSMAMTLFIPTIISTSLPIQKAEAAGSSVAAQAINETKVADLRVEYRNNPIGIDLQKPRFSWEMLSNLRGQKQTAYQLLVATSPNKLTPDSVDIWNSGKVNSSESNAVEYGGKAFKASTRYYWTVNVWDKEGKKFETAPAYFETGLLSTDGVAGWDGAKWISLDDSVKNGAPMLRKETPLKGEVKSARLYISSLGVFDAFINGKKLGIVNGDGGTAYELLAPGWTSYDKNINYMTYDVTDYLQGKNSVTLAAVLGNGWYNSRISDGANYYNSKGNDLGLLAKMQVTYKDGSTQTIVTDTNGWKATNNGPYLADDIYDGQTYDATKEMTGWNNNGFDDAEWKGVKEHQYKQAFPAATITSYNGTPAQIVDSFDQTPISVTTAIGVINQESSKNGKGEIKIDTSRSVNTRSEAKDYKVNSATGDTVIYDLGQNMVGIPRITVKGKAGTQIKLRFGEILNDNSAGADGPKGSIYTANLRSAKASLFYTLKGSEEGETYQPSLTFFGFRYVEISVLTPGATVELDNVTGKVATSAVDVTGTLETSNQDVNQLISNIKWGQRGNYLWVPTDCPQRDERLGWMGDAQLFAKTGMYNMDSSNFFENFTDNMVNAQSANGSYPVTVPASSFGLRAPATSGWSDAGIIIPWTHWQMTGDTTLINKAYNSMEKYMDMMYNQTGETYRGPGSIFGDWLAFQGTNNMLMSDAYYAYDAKLMAQMAAALGKDNDVKKYETLFNNIKKAFIRNHINVDENGNLTIQSSREEGFGIAFYPREDNSQTSLLWALKLGFYDNENQKQQMIKLLVDNIRNNDQYKAAHPDSSRVKYAENTLSVGFLGVNVLAPVLTNIGQSDLAYTLLLQDQMPSWLYSVKNGATTIWERWNSYSVKDGFGDVSMNSFNHYSYGAIGEWMYDEMAGISNDPDHPGFKHTILQPTIDNDKRITWAKGSFDSVYGKIKSEWEVKNGTLTYYATVPANTTATLYIPTNNVSTVKESGQLIAKAKGVKFIEFKDGKAVYELESGSYEFRSIIAGSKPE
ncbi:family 78 glycoside hydrolase catalytic domain [Bacillus sp. ISL-18]|uniref:family 78 glycoside hydrolase catalytic domain n=1 Tax=Bacillus sp. ISL-18 TaxID=2819118 RepID=UPI002034CFE0|nr:family 78 glycoside hydrolase catalytic domain [Bacillus sp. ISL-18]